mmetsp:Transcript_21343/g.32523  ORF Transcript_21343/g.32523 Transcript_21343/m.32523 type:complete len:329 (-) Transcript_21343:1606-2592(-)
MRRFAQFVARQFPRWLPVVIGRASTTGLECHCNISISSRQCLCLCPLSIHLHPPAIQIPRRISRHVTPTLIHWKCTTITINRRSRPTGNLPRFRPHTHTGKHLIALTHIHQCMTHHGSNTGMCRGNIRQPLQQSTCPLLSIELWCADNGTVQSPRFGAFVTQKRGLEAGELFHHHLSVRIYELGHAIRFRALCNQWNVIVVVIVVIVVILTVHVRMIMMIVRIIIMMLMLMLMLIHATTAVIAIVGSSISIGSICCTTATIQSINDLIKCVYIIIVQPQMQLKPWRKVVCFLMNNVHRLEQSLLLLLLLLYSIVILLLLHKNILILLP